LLHALKASHKTALTALPHCYRPGEYHTTEYCHIRTGTDSITLQKTATMLQVLRVSHKK